MGLSAVIGIADLPVFPNVLFDVDSVVLTGGVWDDQHPAPRDGARPVVNPSSAGDDLATGGGAR